MTEQDDTPEKFATAIEGWKIEFPLHKYIHGAIIGWKRDRAALSLLQAVAALHGNHFGYRPPFGTESALYCLGCYQYGIHTDGCPVGRYEAKE